MTQTSPEINHQDEQLLRNTCRFKTPLQIYAFESVPSTQEWIKEILQKSGSTDKIVCTARHQTAGIGRRKSSWQSSSDRNILVSFSFPLETPTLHPGFAMITACHLATLFNQAMLRILNSRRGPNQPPLTPLTTDCIEIKWPNDLLYKKKKLGGLMVEILKDKKGMTHVVTGFGINLAPLSTFPAMDTNCDQKPASLPITSLHEDFPSLTREQFLGDLVMLIYQGYLYLLEGSVAIYRSLFIKMNAYPDRVVSVTQPGMATLYGIIQGIDEMTRLVLSSVIDLKTHKISHSDASLRPCDLLACLVGGAVRDILLGIPVVEQDFVVLHETPEGMTQRGFIPVGKDFPVFLHPTTHEEYALARTEKKISVGHQGFQFHTSPSISLVEDLKRRDLTINAMARLPDGYLVDPFGGQTDIKLKILRHVSPAFAEDPLRVLRVARFAARFASLGFTIAPETLTLMKQISESGELKTLSQERIWQECVKALSTSNPIRFFEILESCGAFKDLFPNHPNLKTELDQALIQRHSAFSKKHRDTLEQPIVRYTLLTHRLSTPLLNCVPNEFEGFRKRYASHHHAFSQLSEDHLTEMVQFLETTDALRNPERFGQLLTLLTEVYPQQKEIAQKLEQYLKQLKGCTIEIDAHSTESPKQQVYMQRIAYLKKLELLHEKEGS